MLEIAEIISLLVLAFFVLVPVYWAWKFSLLFPPRTETTPTDTELPCAAVVLCLRGTDPSLERCLQGLLSQDYPAYDVWIVIDSEVDPAWQAVPAILERFPHENVPVHVRALAQRLDTCSLKLSAQCQAIEEIVETHGRCAAVAFVDADVIPAAGWLRSMVVPLLDPKVGCTTGVRWYTPEGKSWGTLARYLWNAGSETQRKAFGIPWGGSLAFRMDTIHRGELLKQWSHAFSEDTSAARPLKQLSMEMRLVPSALMLNQETINLKNCRTFMRRQLVCVRLHHPGWPWLLLLNCAHGLALAIVLVLAAWACTRQEWLLAACVSGLLGGLGLGLVSALIRVDWHMRRLARGQGIELPTLSVSWRAWLALPLTLLLHIGCLIAATRARRIAWRGITYMLEGNGRVRMADYRPYAQQIADAEQSVV